MSPTRIGLCGFTRHVRRVHRVPAFGRDPGGVAGGYARGARGAAASTCCCPPRSRSRSWPGTRPGSRPPWRCPRSRACCACRTRWRSRTCSRSWACRTRDSTVTAEVAAWNRFPVFVKAPIGTASQGVRLARDRASLRAAAREPRRRPGGPAGAAGGAARDGAGDLRLGPPRGLAREPARARGRRRRVVLEAAASRTRPWPRDLARLGEELDWHGALSLDAILTPDGPSYIDVNPRLVEPGNAWRAGVDLVGALLRVSLGSRRSGGGPARPGVRTHQLLLAVLGEAQHGGGRRGVAREVRRARRAAARTREAPRSSRRCAAIRWRWCPCWLPRSPRSPARARTGSSPAAPWSPTRSRPRRGSASPRAWAG